MGKLHKRHNWRARQHVDAKIDRSEEDKIAVDIRGVEDNIYDESNALVLPSKKRKTKVSVEHNKVVKKLSKKQRKKLERVLDVKEKKANRAVLLEKLQDVQASKSELSLLTSTSEMYSGRPKHGKRCADAEDISKGEMRINAVSGSNRKRKRPDSSNNTMQVSESSSSEDEGEDEEMEEEEMNNAADIEQTSDDTDDMAVYSKEQTEEPVTAGEVEAISVELNGVLAEKKKTEKAVSKPAVHIALERKPDIQEQRLGLPILADEQVIMEAVSENPVTVLCGETGSGKTTQVPQFLYEAGYAHCGGIVGVTEPRRVAAISMSKRVAQEMNLSTREVSYQIRYEGNVTKDTKIKFMTDGVLLKEVQKDFLLTKYKVIIVDEAHERSVYTDILIGLLSRIVPLRHKKGNPLKLIIMSATLRVEDFTENNRLFKVSPPVIKVDARQYPVTIHFNKCTPQEDYVGEAYLKVCKIHRQLPAGGILIFVTGQQEVHTLCAKLRGAFPLTSNVNAEENLKKRSPTTSKKTSLPDIKLDKYSILPQDEEAELDMAENQSDVELSDEPLHSDPDDLDSVTVSRANENEQPMHVLPMYSLLPSNKQSKVFEAPPEGSRLCVVATNVAETSLTIPNVKYVVDSGKVKTKFYDKVTGVSAFRVTWTSKASANQRAGRAGRTGPGHTYRLYSSAVFNDDFEKFSAPEITRRPVDDLVLQMKDMHIDKVVNFPFPTPPDINSLKAAERLLVSLGALEKPPTPKSFKESKMEPSTKVTPLGRAMATFPVSPRYGKMLSLGSQHHLLPYVIALVAALSVQEVFVEIEKPAITEEEKEEVKKKHLKSAHLKRSWAGSGHSLLLGDLMVLLKAVGAWEFAGGTAEFCETNGLSHKAMVEIRKLRGQLTNTVNSVLSDTDVVLDPQMKPPTDVQAKLLRQIILAGLGDHVARRLLHQPKVSDDGKKMKNAFQTMLLEEPVFIHPGSVLYKSPAQYVVYQTIDETSKLYMKGVSAVEAEWMPLFVPNHCQFSQPAAEPSPIFHQSSGTVHCHMASTFGSHFWPLPSVEMDHPETIDRYKWFARFLLEGKVCPQLAKYTPVLLTAPVTMLKTWAKLQPRTETLLNTLVSDEVGSRDTLHDLWDRNPKYLLSTYLEWLPQAVHAEVKKMWPPR